MLGAGEEGDSDCPSTILGLVQPHPHSGCTRPLGTPSEAGARRGENTPRPAGPLHSQPQGPPRAISFPPHLLPLL